MNLMSALETMIPDHKKMTAIAASLIKIDTFTNHIERFVNDLDAEKSLGKRMASLDLDKNRLAMVKDLTALNEKLKETMEAVNQA